MVWMVLTNAKGLPIVSNWKARVLAVHWWERLPDPPVPTAAALRNLPDFFITETRTPGKYRFAAS